MDFFELTRNLTLTPGLMIRLGERCWVYDIDNHYYPIWVNNSDICAVPDYAICDGWELVDQTKAKNIPQRQDSLTDQLKDLIQLATENGMYDAADYIGNLLKSKL